RDNVGGFVGRGMQSGFHRSYAIGNVMGRDRVGGFAGEIHNANVPDDFYTSTSFSSSNVTGSGEAVGGFVGYAYGAFIVDSYTHSYASGNNDVGGFAGQAVGGSDIKRSY